MCTPKPLPSSRAAQLEATILFISAAAPAAQVCEWVQGSKLSLQELLQAALCGCGALQLFRVVLLVSDPGAARLDPCNT